MTSVRTACIRTACIRIAIAAALAAALFAGGSAHAAPASEHGAVVAGANFQVHSPVPCCE